MAEVRIRKGTESGLEEGSQCTGEEVPPAIFFLGRKSEKELRIESLSGQFTLSPVSCIQQLSTIDLPFFGLWAVNQIFPFTSTLRVL